MNNNPNVTLIDAGAASERLWASAARISTTMGSALDIYQRPAEAQKDRKLIEKVLLSGHRSFLEHAKFTFAFSNVSALVEQFFIEFRLASFTVKSRRYVDFSQSGYYIPPDLDDESASLYTKHMDYLFKEYNGLVGDGIPLEDARFVLPYCFCSNFYCSVNARELVRMLRAIKYGRGRNIPELAEIYSQITAQLEGVFPNLMSEITREKEDCGRDISCRFDSVPVNAAEVRGSSELISCTHDAGHVLDIAQSLLLKGSDTGLDAGNDDPVSFAPLSPRVMENISATFVVRNISLSAITHFARHRIQSLVIPPFQRARLDRYITPESVLKKPETERRYRKVFETNIMIIKQLRERQFPNELYLCLSGNTLDIVTTMNARQCQLFFNLRCCNRAQWEIQNIAVDMLRSLRGIQPGIYDQMGPSCYPGGICPEGKLSCGESEAMNMRFKSGNIEVSINK